MFNMPSNKLMNEFHLRRNSNTGYHTVCKLCCSSKRKPTHRYCKRCTDLKEIEYFNGANYNCKKSRILYDYVA